MLPASRGRTTTSCCPSIRAVRCRRRERPEWRGQSRRDGLLFCSVRQALSLGMAFSRHVPVPLQRCLLPLPKHLLCIGARFSLFALQPLEFGRGTPCSFGGMTPHLEVQSIAGYAFRVLGSPDDLPTLRESHHHARFPRLRLALFHALLAAFRPPYKEFRYPRRLTDPRGSFCGSNLFTRSSAQVFVCVGSTVYRFDVARQPRHSRCP